MLNALPDSRERSEMNSDVFLTHHERFHDSIGNLRFKKDPTSVGHHWPDNFVEIRSKDNAKKDKSSNRTLWKHLIAESVAELLGTAILVLIGCASVAQYVLSEGQRSIFLSVDFAFGFGAMVGVYVAGPLSGAHLNPAVSISMLTLRSISILQCLAYILAQYIGAMLGAFLVFGIYYDAINKYDGGERQVIGNRSTAGIFGTFPESGIGQTCLFFDQVVSTAVLLVAICSLSDKRNKLVSNAHIPLAVGFVITAIGVSFGHNCGFPINPARDFGPRLVTSMVGYGSEVFSAYDYYFWIPCVAPVIGALVGTWLYHGYSRLLKIHVGDKEENIVRVRRQLDSQNTERI